MNDRYNALIDKLQQQIYDEARETFGEATFERWRNPKYVGRMANADVSTRVTCSCGDTMEIYLKFDGNRVIDASYVTNGCGSISVCGSFASEMAIGKYPDEIAGIDGHAVLAKLGRLPKDEEHCAFLAAETLQVALHNYMVKHGK